MKSKRWCTLPVVWLTALLSSTATAQWLQWNPLQWLQWNPLGAPLCSSAAGGLDCTWYSRCLEARIPCQGGAADYAIAYAHKYCQRYQARASYCTPLGRQWIYSVHKCLQLFLAPDLQKTPSPPCNYIKQKALESHVLCYTLPPGGPAFCQLSPWDWLQIGSTVKGGLLDELKATLGHLKGAGFGGCTWQFVLDTLSRVG